MRKIIQNARIKLAFTYLYPNVALFFIELANSREKYLLGSANLTLRSLKIMMLFFDIVCKKYIYNMLLSKGFIIFYPKLTFMLL